jgi:plasmid stabilization system protein ParE
MNTVYELEITAFAYNDIIEAFSYYQKISPDLGTKFYEDIIARLQCLETIPTSFRFYKESFRRIILKKFPYLVIYKIAESKVIIYAVVYAGRDPQKIFKKIT